MIITLAGIVLKKHVNHRGKFISSENIYLKLIHLIKNGLSTIIIVYVDWYIIYVLYLQIKQQNESNTYQKDEQLKRKIRSITSINLKISLSIASIQLILHKHQLRSAHLRVYEEKVHLQKRK